MSKSKDYKTITEMDASGGSFVKALSNAAMRADETNYTKLKNAFPDYWVEYGKRAEERSRSLREEQDREQDRRMDIEEEKRAEAWPDKCRDAEGEDEDE